MKIKGIPLKVFTSMVIVSTLSLNSISTIATTKDKIDKFNNKNVTITNETLQNKGINLALGKNVTASSVETDNLTPDKITDGNTNSMNSRWSSGSFANGREHWITIDLGEETSFDKVKLYWENANAKVYRIEISNDNNNWKSIHKKENASGGIEVVSFDSKQKARYVRVYCEKHNPQVWDTVSLFEVEIYNGDVSQDINDVVNNLVVPKVNQADTKLQMPIVPEGFQINFIGADFNQVIDNEMNIYEPLVDTSVIVDFEIIKEDEKRETKGIEIIVPGKYSENIGENKKPNVIPTLREWVGGTGSFQVNNESKIVIDSLYENDLKETAMEFKNDFNEILGKNIEVVVGKPKVGDFYLTLACEDKSIGKEGYYINIDEYVTIEAINKTGAFYSTRSILQILSQTNDTLPKGIIRDYPRYESRGFMLDVARKFFTMDYLEEYLEVMSWYKMNDFQIHLNDNYIWISEETWQDDYSAFRLECDTYPGLASEDGHYTKEEFKNLITMGKNHGVEIIPEIDVPAHSLAFTKYNPSLALGLGKGRDHLDASNPNTYEFVDALFAEYLSGEDPVFGHNDFHIGTDEYFGTQPQLEAFRGFTDYYLKQVRDEYNVTPRLWGSLTKIPGETPVTSENITMNIWSLDWVDAKEMINLGYDIVNTDDTELYIVPQAGYYRDYLDTRNLYNNWEPNNFRNRYKIPLGHPQLKGGMFAVWNDMIGQKANGISELDVYDRSMPATQVLAEKLWAGAPERSFEEFQETCNAVSDVPNSNLTYEVDSVSETILQYNFDNNTNKLKDSSGNNYDATETNINFTNGINGNAIELKGNKSFIDTPIDNKGPEYTASMWVKKDKNGDYSEQILTESSTGALKAVQKATGNVGFSREGYDYSFNYKLPEDEWIQLTFIGELNKTSLYVNGVLQDVINKSNTGKVGTFVLPLDKIGSETKAFKGTLDEINIKNKVEKIIDSTVIPQEQFKITTSSEHPNIGTEGLASFAIDGKEETIWHTKWSGTPDKLPQELTIDLGGNYEINKFSYLPRQDGNTNGIITDYEIQVSTDGEHFIKVAEGTLENNNKLKSISFEKAQATHIKFIAKNGVGGFASASEINVHKAKKEEVTGVTPNKIKDLQSSNITSNSIKLNWENPENTTIKEYIIYKDGIEMARTTDTKFTVEELKSNTLYGFKIIAVSIDGLKSRPLSKNFRTLK